MKGSHFMLLVSWVFVALALAGVMFGQGLTEMALLMLAGLVAAVHAAVWTADEYVRHRIERSKL